jgi:hypothetical protein
MTMQKQISLVAALGALVIGTPPVFAQARGVTNPEAAASEDIAPGAQEQSKREVPLAEVPEAALAAAKNTLEAEPKSAYVVTLMSGEEVYEIESASGGGGQVAVFVTAAGEINLDRPPAILHPAKPCRNRSLERPGIHRNTLFCRPHNRPRHCS